jgi:hypothetical protein
MSKGAKQGKTKMDGVMREGNHCHCHCKAKAKANIGMSVQKNGKWGHTLLPNNTLPERDKSAKQIYRFNT